MEKIANIDLSIQDSVTDLIWERYEAVLVAYSASLFQKGIGTWGGRETGAGERTNYWFVIESGLEEAKQELERLIRNFRLKTWTSIFVSDLADDETGLKKELAEKKEFSWTYFKN